MSLLLTVSIVITTIVPSTAVSAAESSSTEVSISTQNDDNTPQTKIRSDDAETSNADKTDDAQETSKASLEQSQSQQADNDKTDDASTKAATDTNLYQNGSICIYNEQQLKAIGTGTQVYEGDASADTFGTGAVLTNEEGNTLTYVADGSYTLMNDIPLTKGDIWTLPEGFTGSFQGAEITAEKPLYDAETDTIYVYNNYQLATINDPDAIKTVMSNDMIASEFGVGQVVYTDEEKKTQLEYTADHNYVLSKDFTEQMPEMKAAQVQAESTVQLGGRDYIGQVHKVIGDKDYILIGNEQQLREIGKNTQVSPILFSRIKAGLIFTTFQGYVPYYPGDADFNLQSLSETGINVDKLYHDIDDFQYFSEGGVNNKLLNPDFGNPTGLLDGLFKLLEKLIGGLASLVFEQELVSVTDEGKLTKDEYKDHSTLNSEYNDLKYSSDANYIIFRDIDLDSSIDNIESGNGNGKKSQDDPWEPLMLSGDMLGQKNMDPNSPVKISNIVVNQTDPMIATKNIGIGFFGTVSGQSDADSIGTSSSPTVVKNINLSDVKVSNAATDLEVDRSLIDSLLSLVGGVLGGLLEGITDIVTAIIPIPGLSGMDLGDIVQELLTLKSDDPDTYATGSFAGRVTGNVQIENCNVTNASVSNVKDMTGGFVGYSEGIEQYDDLSGLLGETVKLLSKVLNIIPGIGLGDIITLLLEKNVPLGRLIPIGYYKTQFKDCSVTLSSEGNAIGKIETNYNGGFVGVQNGTDMTNCTVNGLVSVTAKNYAGGFAGLERDDTLQGALSELGINSVPDIQSKQTNCIVNSTTLTVSAEESYAGGVNGCMADSISNSSKVFGLKSVTAKKDYAGGFAGRATIGYAITLDKNNLNGTLLGSIGNLINEATVGDLSPSILQLAGIKASEIHDGTVNGTNFIVKAEQSYAGGLIGSGDGTIIDVALADNSSIVGLKSVSAGKDYAGGIAGALTTANGAGLLNEVVGLVQVQEYKVSNISLSVEKVTASGNYAGGAFGLLTGGEVTNVSVETVMEVSADNYAGGFVGRTGVGSLVETEGLNILGLNLVKIDNLLSFGNMMSVLIDNCHVQGNNLVVSSTGNTDGKNYFVGGFVSENNSGDIRNSDVTGLKRVFTTITGYFINEEKNITTSYAGGFAARSQVGGLAEIGADGNTIGGLLGENAVLNIDDLVNAVGYLIPKYTDCYVEFTERNFDEAQVTSAVAGGFIGEMQGGMVDNTTLGNDYAVRKTEYIQGTYYAGGFAGKVLSGGLAESDGLSLLGTHIDVAGLLSLIPTYIPKIKTAGVQSGNNGLKVYATSSIDTDVDSGTAGGYVGLARGANISNSDVSELATKTSEEEPGTNDYAVQAPIYAGGYVGKADIGSAAAVGNSLSVFGIAKIGDLTSAIAAVESKFESCNVYGKTGGFNVKSSEGNAGGYAGIIEGSNFNDSNSYNFEYIEGVVSAGGYAGTIQPGDVAKLVGTADVLKGLVSVDNLLGVAKTFIPRIWNSETTAVPCGGYVKATGESSDATKRGLAGGYVGYNLGGQIQGNKEETIIEGNTPKMRIASAIRIRSVYGTEYAGGYTGLMESANIADTGSFKLLYGLIKLKTPLTAVQAIYATEENTAVYGPLTYVDVNDWNGWVTYVGSKGPYAEEFAGKTFDKQSQLDEFLKDYTYGYDVTAGRNSVATEAVQGGAAGGYVGRMEGGTITSATAEGLKSVNAFRSSGGFAGEMITGDVAEVGGIELAGINISGSLPVLQTFVPVIKNSTVNGYQSGAMIKSQGTAKADPAGIAGGYVGRMIGGQIWGTEGDECGVTGLRQVDGTSYAGGYAGKIDPGSAATVDTASSQGLLNQVLKYLIGTDGSLAEVLNATVSTIRYAKVSAWNEYGIVVNAGKDSKAAGGFAGAIQGAVLGDENETAGLQVDSIRSVTGGEHAGGFFGLADVAAVAEVSGEGNTTILSLIKAGSIDLIDAFRTYVYNADVTGSKDGLTVTASKGEKQGSGESIVYTGNAGGFGGSLLNGSVKQSSVTNLKSVKAPNYTGGFIGHGGKSGTVDADGIGIDKILGLDAGVLDIFGSNIDDCSVTGLTEGYTVQSTNGTEEIAGGFIGNADLSRMSTNTAENLKQVYSDEIAGGFVGKTSMAYLISINVDSPLVDTILQVVNELIKALYIDNLQESDLVNINLPGLLKVELFNDGKTLGVTLLGLKITVALSRAAEDGENDVAIITIGDSEIRLNCTKDGIIDSDGAEGAIANSGGLEINLIKANRTKIEKSTVTGISVGYDVFGGGASNDKDGESSKGYTGGFVGYNDAGLLEGNQMIKADTIRGFAGQIGEFSGYTDTNTSYDALKDPTNIEKANTYQVYRTTDRRLTIVKKGDTVISVSDDLSTQSDTIGEVRYTINHLDVVKTHDYWQDVYITTTNGYAQVPIKVYISDAQADLMYGVETYISTGDETAKPGEMQDPCDKTVNITIQKVWKDNDGKNIQRPTSIKVEVYRLGQNTEEEKVGDYDITGDASSNVWSVTIPELPAVYEQEDGTYKNYTYTVKEVGSQEEYITEYTKDENGYNYVITNTHTSTLVEGDSVVIDFGLPVKVNVLANDAIQGSGTLTGVSKGVLDNIYKVLDSDVTEELNKDNKDEEGWTKGYFGRATVVDGTITYEPTTMEMDSFDQFTYSIKTKTDVTLKQGEAGTIITDDGNDCYIYSTLTVIPATAIYYEDNEGMIKYIDAGLTEEHAKYEGELLASGLKPEYGKWYTVENDQDEKKPAGNQDTDRPGILKPTAQKIEDDMDNMYGYDSNYASTDSNDTSRTKYSNGSSQFVSVTNGKTPIATFTFTGTGFDVISVTDKDTGTVRVQVEKKDSDGKFKKIRAWIVDTYYGYDVKEDENGQFTWIPDPSKGKEALYQLPVIRYNAEDDKEEGDTNFEAYGTYKVTITPMYSILFDRNKSEGVDKGYNFYLDAVRIYSPANLDKTQEIEDVYVQDGEYEPEYQEIRNIVIEAGKFEEPSTSVYIDGCPTATWENYRDVGPSHELYLAPDQVIALTLKANEIPESVRIGVKSVKTGINFKVGYAVKEDKNWIIYGAISNNYCNTATDLYYDITDQCIWELQEDGTYKTKYPVTIKNTSELSSTDSILSLTYIKYTKTPKENSIINEKD